MHQYRTHNCSELTENNINSKVKLSGWVNSKRDYGSLIFIDLRDHYGITQLVIDQQKNNLDLEQIAKIKLESVITIIGKVTLRNQEAINKNIPTGKIEVSVEELLIESLAEQIPRFG